MKPDAVWLFVWLSSIKSVAFRYESERTITDELQKHNKPIILTHVAKVIR